MRARAAWRCAGGSASNVRGRVSLSVGLAVLGWGAGAGATGFSTARFAGEHGHVTTANPTAAYFNPAALSLTRSTALMIDGSLALRSVSFDHPRPSGSPAEPAGAEGANYGEGTLFNVFGGPSLGVTQRLTDSWVVAAGMFAPFAGSGSYAKNDQFTGNTQFPGAEDGIARWHLIDGAQRTLYFTIASAFQIGALSLGVSGNLVTTSVRTLRARNASFSDDLSTEGRSLLEVSGVHGSLGVGAMYEAMPDQLWLGIAYQSQPGFGEMKLTGELTNYFGGFEEDTQRVDFYQSLPDQLRVGGRYRPTSDWELRLGLEYTRWSVFDRQCISAQGSPCAVTRSGAQQPGTQTLGNFIRRWQDAYQVRLGASRFFGPEPIKPGPLKPRSGSPEPARLEVFGGLGFDSSAVPDAYLEPALPDGNAISAALGLRFPISQALAAAMSYTHLYYLPRDTVGKSELESFEGTSRSPDAGGKYKQQIGVINANLQADF